MASINAGGTILAGTIHLQADYVHCNATINGKPMRPGLIQEDQLYVIPSDPDIASLQTSGITRYGYTAHNCSCNNDKTGIILRPVDPKFKVLILERCLNCFRQSSGTNHQSLYDWYLNLPGYEEKRFAKVGGYTRYRYSHILKWIQLTF